MVAMDKPKRLAAWELVKNSVLAMSVSRVKVSAIVLLFVFIIEFCF
jgi:hypothetical protein